ncbi:unnamed protein product [Paramecium primaurelia]|uniref:Uncharacterized protein n=2 Tax=Paramecium TaxID=5884 RepID=A0A8S1T8R5_9CILI|nr:unnamed protein product [Paramecium primaurelia]CAD8147012.1 unnamed protein product [Paramecium pentaurelia]
MHKLRQLQEKDQRFSPVEQDFIPFIKERDNMGKLPNSYRSLRSKNLIDTRIRDTISSNKSQKSKTKINFLKDVYTINHNTYWANLTNVSKVEKKFNLKIKTEYVEQKQLISLNQKLQLNAGIVQHRTQTQIYDSPKLGRNLSMNTIPPLGYYQTQDINIKKQPMFVKMKLQNDSKLKECKIIKTEPCQQIQVPKLELSNLRIQNKIPQELLNKAYQTERLSTEYKFRYTPLHFDNEVIEQQENKIKQLRQQYKVIKSTQI